MTNISLLSPQMPIVKGLTLDILKKAGTADLSEFILISSSSRSNRLLEQELLLEIERQNQWSSFRAPQFATLGSLPHLALELGETPVATAAPCQLAWLNAIQSCAAKDMLLHLGINIKVHSEVLILAQQLASLQSQLAAEQLSCAKIALNPQLSDSERDRFSFLEGIYQNYLRLLKEAGLCDKDHAQQQALMAGNKSLTAQARIMVMCVPEMSAYQRRLLDLCAPQVEFIQLDFAHLPQAFDAYGCVRPEVFAAPGNTLLEAVKIKYSSNPQTMVDCALQMLGEGESKTPPEEITFSLLEKQCTPFLDQKLNAFGVELRTAVGGNLKDSLPVLLLTQLKAYLEHPNFENGAELLTHPDLLPNPRLKQELDSLRQTSYLQFLPAEYLKMLPAAATAKQLGLTQAIYATREFLLEVYGETEIKPEQNRESHLRAKSLEMVAATLNELQEVHDCLANDPKLRFSFSRSLDFILHQFRGKQIAQRYSDNSVECLDWLELNLDPAREVVILGFNENHVPGKSMGNMFIDSELAQRLNMSGDQQRLARDSYIVQSLALARRHTGGRLHLICGRAQNDGTPLLPSRLLFLCDEEKAYANAAEFCAAEEQPALITTQHAAERKLPRAADDSIPSRVSVTAINSYLNSPYSFYLSNNLRLRSVDTQCDELNPLVYGNFAHEVLQNFGRSEVRHSQNAVDINAYLRSECQRLFDIRFPSPSAIIRAQIAILEQRYQVFSELQAQRTAKGWLIKDCERNIPKGVKLFDSQFDISGVIDRIDVRDNEICLIDYKTPNSKANYLQKKLFKNGAFTDLQLPLYHFLSRSLTDLEGYSVSLSYSLLTANSSEAGFYPLDFDKDQQQIAEQQCRDIFECIHNKNWFDLGKAPYAGDTEQAIRGDSLLGVTTIGEDVQ